MQSGRLSDSPPPSCFLPPKLGETKKGAVRPYQHSVDALSFDMSQGILRRKKEENKLSWEETYQAMAEEKEDWSDFDAILLDGLEGPEGSIS